MKERLQKTLASMGVGSRRRAEEMIARAEVLVNGRVASIGETVDPEVDVIVVRGKALGRPGRKLYLALNKPPGYVTSLHSTHGEPTVLDLVRLDERVFPVGRLDRDTGGLLLLTNDGDWANIIAHPRHGVEKEYRVLVRGVPSPRVLSRVADGIALPDGSVTAPIRVRLIRTEGADGWLSVVLLEGKKRQIRLMCQAVGHPVLRLTRVRVGDIQLGELSPGRWRHLTAEEVESIREHARGEPAPSAAGAAPPDRHRRSRRGG